VKILDSLKNKSLLFELKLRHVVKNLPLVWKTSFLVLFLVFLLSGFVLLYKIDQKLSINIPTEGGVLREGVVGTPRFVNPVLSISDADRDLTNIVYSGLMRFGKDELTPDLAESYEVDENGLCYTFTLKPNLLWSDNTPLTSDDIIFTINLIQHPNTKSSKRASWEGVKAEKIDDRIIKFCLEKPYAPFLENTTTGILPLHIWRDILPEQLPLSNFNINAIGSGPYKIKNISRNSSGIITSYTLTPNDNFVLQKPYLKKIVLKFYPSEKKLITAYEKREVDSLSAISPQDVLRIKKESSFLKTYKLPRIFAAFFNQDYNSLFAKKEIREALNLSTDKQVIIEQVLQNFGVPANGPIPPGSLGYIESEPSKDQNFSAEDGEEQLNKAKKILEKNGWKLSSEGIMEKKTKTETLKLEFSLSTSDVPDLINTAQMLKEMWGKIGANVDIKIYEIGDLEQNVIRPRKYDALLFGEIMGKDPDAFAFWHSSQRNDPGLNIALYTNITVDKLLEDARETFDTRERKLKYEAFQEELLKDIPAVFIYSPYFIHILPKDLKGLTQNSLIISSDRFSQIYNWHIKTKKIWKIFLN